MRVYFELLAFASVFIAFLSFLLFLFLFIFGCLNTYEFPVVFGSDTGTGLWPKFGLGLSFCGGQLRLKVSFQKFEFLYGFLAVVGFYDETAVSSDA